MHLGPESEDEVEDSDEETTCRVTSALVLLNEDINHTIREMREVISYINANVSAQPEPIIDQTGQL